MSDGYHIRYLQRKEIDTEKWNTCIAQATNGLVYAFSFYLDCMAKNWDVLVLNDYEAVMPLTWNKKFNIHYLYQPAFTASLGIFGNSPDKELVAAFINKIPAKFRLIEISLNYGNLFDKEFPIIRNNYILPLNRNYDELYSNYRENIRRNIKRAQQLGCTIKKDIPLADIIALSTSVMQRVSNIKEEDYTNFKKLYDFLRKRKEAITWGIYTADNELAASCAFFFSHKRAYYILVGNHPNGKTLGASHFLIDRFIYDHAGRDLLLDFEGSDIRNLAFFYSSFGADLEIYPFLSINRLPSWLKWLKRSGF